MNSKISVRFDRSTTHSGENKCTSVEITLPNELLNYWVYIDFLKPDETKFKTPKLDIVNNKVIYDLPSSLLDQNGIIQAQVVLENEDGVIYKSSIIKRKIYESINASDDIPNQESFVSVIQTSLNKMEKLNNDVQNGLTPTIGENENWYICGKDTGKPSRGKDGVITDEDYNRIVSMVEDDLEPRLNDVEVNSENALNIAKGANQSLVYNNYSEMIAIFNSLDNDVYKVGQNILIITLDVPDLWISEVKDIVIPYTYITDDEFVTELNENGYIQIGHYKISALETQKVNLPDYIKKAELQKELEPEWIDIPITNSVFTPASNGYGGGCSGLQYRKIGNHVYIRAGLEASSISANAETIIAQVPDEIIPKLGIENNRASICFSFMGTGKSMGRGQISSYNGRRDILVDYLYDAVNRKYINTATWVGFYFDYYID